MCRLHLKIKIYLKICKLNLENLRAGLILTNIFNSKLAKNVEFHQIFFLLIPITFIKIRQLLRDLRKS